MANKPLSCRLGLHQKFHDSALVTSGVIRCYNCTWVEDSALAAQLAHEREIASRGENRHLSAGELYRLIHKELPNLA